MFRVVIAGLVTPMLGCENRSRNIKFEQKYPALFNEVTWSSGPTRARFKMLCELSPSNLIANVNIIPQVGDSWIILQHANHLWDVPGGTLEEGEKFMDTLHRELIEEVGAKLISYAVFGAWHCFSKAIKPYRRHLPHPEYYRLVGTGCVEVFQPPTNPPDGEKILRVAAVSMEQAIKRFEASRRNDLAQLYQLASEVARNGDYPQSQ